MALGMSFMRKFAKLRVITSTRPCACATRHLWSKSKPEETNDDEDIYVSTDDIIDEELKAKQEAEIEKKRNKSRLQEQHYNIQNGRIPYPEPMFEFHHSLTYKRRLFGRYGNASGVDPTLVWPSKLELEEKKEYESVAYPMTIMETLTKLKTKKAEEDEFKRTNEKEISEKMKKLNIFTKEFENKVAKKLEDARIAKEKKARMIEEVRRQFGYEIDPRDPKFQEFVEAREKEAKKARKEAKKKQREEELLKKYAPPPVEEVEE